MGASPPGGGTSGIESAWCSSPFASPIVQTSASRIGDPCWVIDTASDSTRFVRRSVRAVSSTSVKSATPRKWQVNEAGRRNGRVLTRAPQRERGEVATVRTPDPPVLVEVRGVVAVTTDELGIDIE